MAQCQAHRRRQAAPLLPRTGVALR